MTFDAPCVLWCFSPAVPFFVIQSAPPFSFAFDIPFHLMSQLPRVLWWSLPCSFCHPFALACVTLSSRLLCTMTILRGVPPFLGFCVPFSFPFGVRSSCAGGAQIRLCCGVPSLLRLLSEPLVDQH